MDYEAIVLEIHDMLDGGGEAEDPYTSEARILKKIADLVGATFTVEC